jgi:hypothetical protein
LNLQTCYTRSSTVVVQLFTQGAPIADVFAFEIGVVVSVPATQVLDFTTSVPLSPKYNTFRVYLVDTFSYNANIGTSVDAALASSLASAEYVQDLTGAGNQVTTTDNFIKFSGLSYSGNNSVTLYLSAGLECYYGSNFVMPMFQVVNATTGSLVNWTYTNLTQQCPTVETDKAWMYVQTSNFSNEKLIYAAFLVGGSSALTIQTSIPYSVTDAAVHAYSTVYRPPNTSYETIGSVQTYASTYVSGSDYRFNFSVSLLLASDGYSNVSLIMSISSPGGAIIGNRKQMILGPISQTPTEFQAYLTSSTSPYPSKTVINLSLVDTMLYAKSSSTALSKAYASYTVSITSPAKPPTASPTEGGSSSGILQLTGSSIALIVVGSLVGGALVGCFVKFRMKKATTGRTDRYRSDDSEKGETLLNMQGQAVYFENLERQKKTKLADYMNFQLS